MLYPSICHKIPVYAVHDLKRISAFVPTYKTLPAILADDELAALGDAYVNLVYSLYLSVKSGRAVGEKVDNRALSEALRHAGLRKHLAARTDRHKQADAAESLLVYAWLQEKITITESVGILMKHEDAVEAFSSLLSHVDKRLGL